ncbi:protein mono-ADP-ribosyltransferase PARP15-like [Rhinophrynus dorsalis]
MTTDIRLRQKSTFDPPNTNPSIRTYIRQVIESISKVILSAAGTSVKEECQLLGRSYDPHLVGKGEQSGQGKQPHGNVVVSGAGDLKCKKIIHLIGATTPPLIEAAVKNALGQCDQHHLASIAFPAVGTGAVKLDTQRSIEAILRGTEEYLTDAKTSSISEIHIVAFTPNVHQEYLKFFQKKITNLQISQFHLKIDGKVVELIKGDITDQAVDCIVNLTNITLNQTSGVSGAILSAAGNSVKEECKSLGALPANGIVVTSGGNLKSRNILHLVGPTTASAIVSCVEQILQECNKHSFGTVALPAIGTGIAAVNPKESSKAILDGISNHFKNVKNTSLVRICIIAYKEDIYQTFSKDFETNSLEIERIQNVKLWRSYFIKKESVDSKYPNQQNVHHLYHGTDFDTTKKINLHGFNRSYSGKNATVYGKGTYFARDASYSCQDTYAISDIHGHRHVYLASVITGKWCMGNHKLIDTPPTKENPSMLYNCAVDSIISPSIYVVFCDDGAYPEYLITFKKL